MLDKVIEQKLQRRSNIEKRPTFVDCSTQANFDNYENKHRVRTTSCNCANDENTGSKTRRGNVIAEEKDIENAACASFDLNECRPQYRDKSLTTRPDSSHARDTSGAAVGLSSPNMSRNSSRSTLKDNERGNMYGDVSVMKSPPGDRSWRRAVYGDLSKPETRTSKRKNLHSNRSNADQVSAMNANDENDDPSDNYWLRNQRSSRRSGGSTPSVNQDVHTETTDDRQASSSTTKAMPSRSSSREDALDERAPRRKTRNSSTEMMEADKEKLLCGGSLLTPENISLRDSIEKVMA